jgi:hypothetical protein
MFDDRMRFLSFAALAIAIAAAGCGAAENEPNLAEAVEKTQATGSSLISITGTAEEGVKTIEMTCTGGADYGRRRLQLECDSGRSVAYELIVVGDTMYARGDLLGVGGAGSKWIKFPDDENLTSEFSPERLLSMLRAASQDTRRVGEEDVRGVTTLHHVLEVDCVRAELSDCDGPTAPVDVWIGDDRLVRRIQVEEGSSPATVEFYDFGVHVAVRVPAADQVKDLGDLFGARACGSDFGAPIGVGTALDALRRHGLSVGRSAQCSVSFAAFENANVAREGYLSCFLYESPQPYSPTSVQRRGADGADAELALHNLECTLLADSPAAEERIDRLEAAFAELERTVRP